jgi:hypothetical protein
LKLHSQINVKKFLSVYKKNVKFSFNDNVGINTITKNQLNTKLESYKIFKCCVYKKYIENIRDWLLFYFYLKNEIKVEKLLLFFCLKPRRFLIIIKNFRKKFKIKEKEKNFSKKLNDNSKIIAKVFVILEKKKNCLIFSSSFNSKNTIFSLLRFYSHTKNSHKKVT